jgi:SAM-dependent methyltransferase
MPEFPLLSASVRRTLRRAAAQALGGAGAFRRRSSGEHGAPVGRLTAPDDGIARTVDFSCNLCGRANRVDAARIARETSSCSACGSTVRFRAIGRLVMREVLGTDTPLVDADRTRGTRGLGLSDAGVYARPLARVFEYRNTFLHRRPRLDILNIPDALCGCFRFVIASDVFEHVVPPVARAFENVRRLLAPGGVLIFTAPFTDGEDTVEHFPDLHDWRLERRNGQWRLLNATKDGRRQAFDAPVLHGGRGTTLEMRVFALAALRRHFTAAGFQRMRVANEPCAASGIAWPGESSTPIVAYA